MVDLLSENIMDVLNDYNLQITSKTPILGI